MEASRNLDEVEEDSDIQEVKLPASTEKKVKTSLLPFACLEVPTSPPRESLENNRRY